MQVEVKLPQEFYKSQAQTRKALKLAQVLASHGATGDQIALMPAAARRMAEKLAKVDARGPSSDATWGVVAALLDGAGPDTE